MNSGPGATGLLWLWATVAGLGPGDPPEPPPGCDHDSRRRLAGLGRMSTGAERHAS